MRSWLLSNTFYGTWLPGDERGSVTSVSDVRPEDVPSDFRFQHDIPGTPWEEGIPQLHRAAAAQMKGPPIHFDLQKAEIVLAQFQETATYRGRLLRAVSIMYNHCHLVVQTADDPDPGRMLADFKAYASRALNRCFGKPPADTWWTTNGSKRKLRDEQALAAAIHYVLYKQRNPLVVWSPETGRILQKDGRAESVSDRSKANGDESSDR
jgi:REP element-mobilizing transposase RayT